MCLFPHYTHIINPKLKHIYLSFDDEGNLLIKSPKVSQKHIEQLLIKKSKWITRSREKLKQKRGKTPQFDKNPTLYFMGKSYPIILAPYEKKYTKLIFDGNHFILYYKHYNQTLFQKQIDNFYKKESLAYIPPLVEKWAKLMGLNYQSIAFRKTKRQWGSCSSQNKLHFNTMIMKLPLSVIEYIVIHELAHIRHKHHQKAFWLEITQYLPDYRTAIDILKTYTTH